MSEEKTQVQNARKDLDILNKMKNLPGGLVIITIGNRSCTCNICTTGIPDRWICNSTFL